MKGKNDKIYIALAAIGGLGIGYVIANAMANQRIASIQQAIAAARAGNGTLDNVATIANASSNIFGLISKYFTDNGSK